jgi:hypothetical protein
LVPGTQEPPQLPLEQRFGQAIPAVQVPFWSQVFTVSPAGPPHIFAPGLQVPVQSPWPVQAFAQGWAAAVHCPSSPQLSGVWSTPHWRCPGTHIPRQTPPMQIERHASFMIQSPVAVQTSIAEPLDAQRVAPALQADPAVEASGAIWAPSIPAFPFPRVLGGSVGPPAPPCEESSVETPSAAPALIAPSLLPESKPPSSTEPILNCVQDTRNTNPIVAIAIEPFIGCVFLPWNSRRRVRHVGGRFLAHSR